MPDIVKRSIVNANILVPLCMPDIIIIVNKMPSSADSILKTMLFIVKYGKIYRLLFLCYLYGRF